MPGRPVDIGKRGERGVVNALRRNGFPGAERRKAGRWSDQLDITVCPGIVGSVKAGEQAKRASLARVATWRAEATAKRIAEGAAVALLVVHRTGVSDTRAEDWRCWILGLDRDEWETTLGRACRWLRDLGWGEPAEEAS